MKDRRFKIGDKVECEVGGEYYLSRFKLVEPVFTPEYFSALNENDAEKYIGKVMEFADVENVRNNKWVKSIFKELRTDLIDCIFEAVSHCTWAYMRTCPETFAKKKVKKTVECWENMYDDHDSCYHETEEKALSARNPYHKFLRCVKLTGEYEVEE